MKRRNTKATGDDEGREFASPKKLKRSSGKVQKGSFEHRFERRRYLNQLVDEFQTTESIEAKRQVLANLANFAYDPYNYHFFQEIGVIPLFLAELSVNRDQFLTEYAIAGICNCVADRRIYNEVLKHNAIPIVKQHAYSTSPDVILSSVTTLISCLTKSHHLKECILSENFYSHLSNLTTHSDKRIQNVVKILSEELIAK